MPPSTLLAHIGNTPLVPLLHIARSLAVPVLSPDNEGDPDVRRVRAEAVAALAGGPEGGAE